MADNNQNIYNLGAGDAIKIETNFWPRLKVLFLDFKYNLENKKNGLDVPDSIIRKQAFEIRKQINKIKYNLAGIESNAYLTEYKNLENIGYILDSVAYNIQLSYSMLNGQNILSGFEILFINESTQNIIYDPENPLELEIILMQSGVEYSETFLVEQDISVGGNILLFEKMSATQPGINQVRYILSKVIDGNKIIYCDTILPYSPGT